MFVARENNVNYSKVRFLLGAVVSALVTCILIQTNIVSARAWSVDWMQDPLVYETSESAPSQSCEWQKREITQYRNNRYPTATTTPTDLVDVCVYMSGDVEYASYSRDAFDGAYRYIPTTERAIAVSLGSSIMTPIDNIPWNIRLLGSTGGPFVYADPGISGGFTLKIYHNFAEHLSTSFWNGIANFTLDNGYDTYKRIDGVDASIDGPYVSANGAWISFAVNNYGIMRMNTQTMQTQKVADYVYRRWAWPAQGAETSISIDGKHILVSGSNVPFTLIEDNGHCGVEALVHDYYDTTSIGINACLSRGLNVIADPHTPFPPNSNYVYSHTMIDSSTTPARLVFYDGTGWAVIRPSSERLYYLALGDSFAAGEGDVTIDGADHYLPGTNVQGKYTIGIPREMCHISTRSYPMRIAQSMQLVHGQDMRSVACAGGVLTDVLAINKPNYIDPSYLGQSTQLIDSNGPRLTGISTSLQLQDDARAQYIPGRVQQIEFVKKSHPKYITIMMGGNDLDFGGVLSTCAFNALFSKNDTCDYSYGEGLMGEAKKIHDIYPKLVEFYKAIKEVSPQTTIYVIGYPQFMDEDNADCMDMANLFSKTERRAIHDLISYANAVIHNAALDGGAKFIDISDAMSGGKLCSDSIGMTGVDDILYRWIYTEIMKSVTKADSNIGQYLNVIPGGSLNYSVTQMYIAERLVDAVSKTVSSPATVFANIFQELSHPNAVGHEAIYNKITQGLGDLLLESESCNVIVSCPDTTLRGLPEVGMYLPGLALRSDTVYLQGKGVVTVGRRGADGTVTMGTIVKSGHSQFIHLVDDLDEGPIDNSMPVTVEIHSDVTELGSMTRVEGGYELAVSLPRDVQVGQHVLRIKGMLTNGQKFDIDAPVFVEGPSGDIDDDGVSDADDTCAFGTPSGVDADQDGRDDVCDLIVSKTLRPSMVAEVSQVSWLDDEASLNDEMVMGDSVKVKDFASSELKDRPRDESAAANTPSWMVVLLLGIAGVLCAAVVWRRFKQH